jgi:starch synthase
MKKSKILFVSQEIFPYLDESHMANLGRFLPQGIQDKGKEIRTFMPKFGLINERRNQLHEVIRLSGMNIIIDDADHPLIIKVASIQSARMQVYFIDNEEYFQRKHIFSDANENSFEDNDERSLFFCKGVLETVKKLGWAPDIIHCHGWMTSLLPMLVKRAYAEDPIFADSKIVYSVYNDDFEKSLNKKYHTKIAGDGITEADLKRLKDPSHLNLTKHAIDFSDAVIKGNAALNADIEKHLKSLEKPVLEFHDTDTYVEAYSNFYDEVLINETVLVDLD